MKILYIANARIPTDKAHGLQIMKMCEAFSRAGTEVNLILPGRENKQYQNADPFVFYAIKDKFTITNLKAPDPVWLFRLPQGIYIKFQSLLFGLTLWRYFRKNKIAPNDYICTREEYLLPWLLRFSGKTVWEGHSLPARKHLYLKYWRRCHKIIAITSGLMAELVRLGVEENKILVAPDGVDLDDFEKITADQATIRKKLDLPSDKKIIMYTGHLYDWKGADVLAEAAKSFSSDELFVFVGGTEKEVAEFKNRYASFGNIQIVGQVKHELIPYYLKAADILVLPNSAKKEISKYYTSPMKLFEYLAAGKPIVASDLPSIREILNEQSACLVEPDSAESLAAGMKQILADKALAEDMAKYSLVNAKIYSWNSRVYHILKFLTR